VQGTAVAAGKLLLLSLQLLLFLVLWFLQDALVWPWFSGVCCFSAGCSCCTALDLLLEVARPASGAQLLCAAAVLAAAAAVGVVCIFQAGSRLAVQHVQRTQKALKHYTLISTRSARGQAIAHAAGYSAVHEVCGGVQGAHSPAKQAVSALWLLSSTAMA
jgi:hypothetical protein